MYRTAEVRKYESNCILQRILCLAFLYDIYFHPYTQHTNFSNPSIQLLCSTLAYPNPANPNVREIVNAHAKFIA